MKLNNILSKNYINNASDILALSKNDIFKILLAKTDSSLININSKLIHKNITYQEQFIFNLDNYISFIKSNLKLDQLQIRYIIELTLSNKFNNILLNKIYYYDNKNYYIKEFKNLFMFNYIKNYNILKKYIKIKKLNFEDFINRLNQSKNKAHFYFEDINKNLPYYISIIDYLEKTSNI